MEIPALIPVLPIRNAVVFPGASMPLIVGRPRSVRAVEAAQNKDGLLLVLTQRHLSMGDPKPEDLYRVGTLCRIEGATSLEGGSFQIVITGLARCRVTALVDGGHALSGRSEPMPDQLSADRPRTRALFNSLKRLAREIIELLPGAGEAVVRLLDKLDNELDHSGYLSNLCAAYLNLDTAQKQELLEQVAVEARIVALLDLMQKEREVLRLQKDIQEKMSERLGKAQRDALLREQLRTIREELGESPGDANGEMGEGRDIDEFFQAIRRAELPPEVRKIANRELKRLEGLPQAAAEYHVIRTYLELIAELPWKKVQSESSPESLDLARARRILDEDHFGMERVKKRIIQYLAVAKLKRDLRGPIICLVGPPGVGKTSLGQSVARALGRRFVRTSLGGVRDEAEIRGHRRTYIGAMPGRIVQSIRRAGVNNPVFMLDEIDKLGASYQGDPASAMLEVLDPEQNSAFVDHYLDVPFDLSDTFFIATANVQDTIPPPLRDRMEIIELSGYTTAEKIDIARRYLVTRQLREHGLSETQVSFKDDDALLALIQHYTREAGVRQLQREIAAVLRSCAEKIVERPEGPSGIQPERIIVSATELPIILGPEKHQLEVSERAMRPGVATGLAWTAHGGEILFVEASFMLGTGQLVLTGQLGDVMKESAKIALSSVRSEAERLVPHFRFDKHDIHVHVPSGAIPKDGPSAGVTILTALTSLLAARTIDPKLAMTGELTLRGAVLPVGGVKEKLIAAHRAGIERVLLPRRNAQDVTELPAEMRAQLKITFVETVEDLLSEALGLGRGEVLRQLAVPTAPAA